MAANPPPIHGAYNPQPSDPRGSILFFIVAIVWMLFAPAPAFVIFGLAIALPVVEAIMTLWGSLLLFSLIIIVLLILGKRSPLLKRLTIAAMVMAGSPLAGAIGFIVWVFIS
jgi:predicted permease